jgi:hypothetical protein
MDGIIAESVRVGTEGRSILGEFKRNRRKAGAELPHSKRANEEAAAVCQKSEIIFMLMASTGVLKTANGGAREGY